MVGWLVGLSQQEMRTYYLESRLYMYILNVHVRVAIREFYLKVLSRSQSLRRGFHFQKKCSFKDETIRGSRRKSVKYF